MARTCRLICTHGWFFYGYWVGRDTRDTPPLGHREIFEMVEKLVQSPIPWDEGVTVIDGYKDGRRCDLWRLRLGLRNCRVSHRGGEPQQEKPTVSLSLVKEAKSLKKLLDSFCTKKETNFKVVCSTEGRSIAGRYHRKSRTITIYLRTGWHMERYSVGLHKLAQHLVWERHGDALERRAHRGQRTVAYGKEFKDILEELLKTFKSRYGHFLVWFLEYDRRRPHLLPRWEYLLYDPTQPRAYKQRWTYPLADGYGEAQTDTPDDEVAAPPWRGHLTQICNPYCSHLSFFAGFLLGRDGRERPRLTDKQIITGVKEQNGRGLQRDEKASAIHGYGDARRGEWRRFVRILHHDKMQVKQGRKITCVHRWFYEGYLLGWDDREDPRLTARDIIARVQAREGCEIGPGEKDLVMAAYDDGRRGDSRRLQHMLESCILEPMPEKETRTVNLNLAKGESTKRILASCCFEAEESNFEVVLSAQRCSIAGKYDRKSRTITIHVYPGQHIMDVEGIGFYELAHHVMWERYGHRLERRARQRKGIAPHGKEFQEILEQMLGTFNFRYREFFHGILLYDRRRPRLMPHFEYFPWHKGPKKMCHFA